MENCSNMQKEPKKCMYTKDDFTDEDRKVLCDGCEEDCKYAQKQELTDKDLEAEIIRYIGYPQEVDEDVSTTMIRKAARHFTAWQRERMMKDVVTETVEDAGGRYLQVGPIGLDDEFVANNNLNPGDKVKLIIIKEN
jgi:hypothetical protein